MLIDKAAEMGKKEVVNAKGQITDMQAFNDALFALMDDRFKGGMEIQSKTFDGMISNVKDSFSTMGRELSKPIFEKLKQGLEKVMPIIGAFTQTIQGDWLGARDTLTEAFGADAALKIEVFFTKIYSYFNQAKQFITDLMPTFENIKEIIINIFPLLQDLGLIAGAAIDEAADHLPGMLEGLTGVAKEFTEWEGFVPIVEGITAGMAAYELMVDGVAKAEEIWNKVKAVGTVLQGAWKAAVEASAASGGGLKGALVGLRAGFMSLNATMAANPILLIIAVIIGLGVALVMAYKKSETFRNIVNGVWSSLKEGFFAVINWFQTTIPQWINNIQTWFKGFWDWIKSFFLKWGTTILAVIAPFIGIPLLIYQHWDQIKAWLAGVWNSIVATVMVGVNYVVGLWKSLVAMVMPIIKGFINAVVTGFNNFKTNIMTVINPIITFFTNTWDNIKLLVLSIIGLFLDLLLGRFGDAKIALLGIWTAFQRQFENIVTTIKDVGLAIFNIFANGLSAIWDGIKTVFSTVWNVIKSTATNVWNGLKTAAVNTFEAMKTWVVNTWNALKDGAIDAAKNLHKAAIQKFNDIKTGISTAVDNAKSAVVNGFINAKDTAINTIINMYNAVVDWFKKIPTKAKETATNLVSEFKNIDLTQIGKDIIQGLLNGIAGMAKKVWDKANDIADGITTRIKKALDIHSPSRVTMWMGEMLGAGMVEGMDSSLSGILKMSTRLADASIPDLQAFKMPADNLAWSQKTGATSHDPIEITIHNINKMDSREVGRSTYKHVAEFIQGDKDRFEGR